MCDKLHIKKEDMPTNLALDDELIDEARKLGGHKSKKEAVTAALKEYIQRHKQAEIIHLFGKIEFDPTYDYKKERAGRR
jgi:Arc/MetJ family transcription regulator